MLGHDTNNCRELREEVESLIRRERLQEFVVKPKEMDRLWSQPPPQQGSILRAQQTIPDHNPSPLAQIRMMVGENQFIEGSRRAICR